MAVGKVDLLSFPKITEILGSKEMLMDLMANLYFLLWVKRTYK